MTTEMKDLKEKNQPTLAQRILIHAPTQLHSLERLALYMIANDVNIRMQTLYETILHQYWSDMGDQLTEELREEEVELLRRLGFQVSPAKYTIKW